MHEAAFGRPDEARLVARLRAEASPCVSLVAERAGRVIGHVFCSPVAIEGEPQAGRLGRRATSEASGATSPAPAAGGLGPVGVLPEAQGGGAGGALVRAALAASRALDWQLLFLLGDPGWYARFGFVLAAPHGLHYESHAFDAAFQVQELVPGALAQARGWVRYHPAFAEPRA